MVDKAEAGVRRIQKSDLSECMAFASPPPILLLVMNATCVMLEETPDWRSGKRLLHDMKFLQRVVEFDKDDIRKKTLRKFRRYYDNADFQPQKVAKVSFMAHRLCLWWRSVFEYHTVLQEVRPNLMAMHHMAGRRQQQKAAAATGRPDGGTTQ